jgi:hypothetical protein
VKVEESKQDAKLSEANDAAKDKGPAKAAEPEQGAQDKDGKGVSTDTVTE